VTTDIPCEVELDLSGALPTEMVGAVIFESKDGLSHRAAISLQCPGGQKSVEIPVSWKAGVAARAGRVAHPQGADHPHAAGGQWKEEAFDLGVARIVLPEKADQALKEDAAYLAAELKRRREWTSRSFPRPRGRQHPAGRICGG